MNDDRGLFAMTLVECDVVLEWFSVASSWGGLVVDGKDALLQARLLEWKRRHSSEDIPG